MVQAVSNGQWSDYQPIAIENPDQGYMKIVANFKTGDYQLLISKSVEGPWTLKSTSTDKQLTQGIWYLSYWDQWGQEGNRFALIQDNCASQKLKTYTV